MTLYLESSKISLCIQNTKSRDQETHLATAPMRPKLSKIDASNPSRTHRSRESPSLQTRPEACHRRNSKRKPRRAGRRVATETKYKRAIHREFEGYRESGCVWRGWRASSNQSASELKGKTLRSIGESGARAKAETWPKGVRIWALTSSHTPQ